MNSTAIEVQATEAKPLARRSLFDLAPKNQIAYASEIATALSDVVTRQNLFSVISGRKYIKVEGWSTLGTMLGVLPKERTVSEHQDGSYEAYVDLIRVSDGLCVGGGSAICGVDEKRWAGADKYARRSMAITRATGKAYRLAFSWIVTLAGYEPTPEEEMPTSGETIGKVTKEARSVGTDDRGQGQTGTDQDRNNGRIKSGAGGDVQGALHSNKPADMAGKPGSGDVSLNEKKKDFAKAATAEGFSREQLKDLWDESQKAPEEVPAFLKRKKQEFFCA